MAVTRVETSPSVFLKGISMFMVPRTCGPDAFGQWTAILCPQDAMDDWEMSYIGADSDETFAVEAARQNMKKEEELDDSAIVVLPVLRDRPLTRDEINEFRAIKDGLRNDPEDDEEEFDDNWTESDDFLDFSAEDLAVELILRVMRSGLEDISVGRAKELKKTLKKAIKKEKVLS